MEFVLSLHSFVRYLALLVAMIGLLKTAMNLVMQSFSETADPMLATAFLGLFDLQAFLGILIIFLGGLRGPLHPLLMFIALVIAHVLAASVKHSERARVNWLRLALYAAPLAIVFLALWIVVPIRS